jgi:hypothetical protein
MGLSPGTVTKGGDKSRLRTHDDGHTIEDLVRLNLTQNQEYFSKLGQKSPLQQDSVETFLDPREMLKKEINPMKIKKLMPTPVEIDKNTFFKDFKQKWDHQMHYVVDEYKTNIFP